MGTWAQALIRVVLDTNLLVSALVLRSPSLSWLPLSWTEGDLLPLVSEETSSELSRVVRYSRFRLTVDLIQGLLNEYLPWCEMVEVLEPPAVPECRDPSDRPFLELALFAQADALVTGDADLLGLGPVFQIPITTATELRRRLTNVD